MKFTKKVQKENRELWLAALRSKKYKQTQEVLRRLDEKNKESFCCLGVLTKVMIDKYCSVLKVEDMIPIMESLQSDTTLHDTVQEMVGLHSGEGCPVNPSESSLDELVVLNDNGFCVNLNEDEYVEKKYKKATFVDIADHLEKHEKEYFK